MSVFRILFRKRHSKNVGAGDRRQIVYIVLLYYIVFLNYAVIRYNEINPYFGAFLDFIAA